MGAALIPCAGRLVNGIGEGYDSCFFSSSWYRYIPKSIIKQTGGVACGSISIKSNPRDATKLKASAIGKPPTSDRSSETTLTSIALIFRLTRGQTIRLTDKS